MASPFTGTYLPALIDDFNRADSISLGGSWTEGSFGPWGDVTQIVSNLLTSNAGPGIEGAAYNSSTSALEIAVSLDFTTWATGARTDSAGLVVRTTAADAGYAVTVDDAAAGNDKYNVYRTTAGALDATLAATQDTGAVFANGDLLGLYVYDNGSQVQLILYRAASGGGAWSQIGTYTDSVAGRKSGPYYPGVMLGENAANGLTTDNFRAEAVVATSPNFQPIGSRWARPPSWHAIPGSLRFRNWSNNPGTVFAIDVAAADATLPPKDIVTLQAVNRSSTW
jgi:hypothetical protein